MNEAEERPGESGMSGDGTTARSFEALIDELEAIVARLGRDDLELDEALGLFERGVGCLRDAGRFLDSAEGRVEELIESASGDFEAIGFEVPDRNGGEAGTG